jgi:hypothetical protein
LVTHAPDRGRLVLWRLRARVGSALAVWTASQPVRLSIAGQVLNAFRMPLAVGFLMALAATALTEPYRAGRGRLPPHRRHPRDRVCARRIRGLQALV